MIPTITQASVEAPHVDRLFWMLTGLSTAIMLIVGLLVLTFAIRYRASSEANRGPLPQLLGRDIELGWTAATLFVALFFFWWASSAQVPQLAIPRKAMEIHIVAKQWMWKAQHPGGQREIDALHVPAGVPVKLVMTSQDVIHSFFVPAFRMKQDVLPGRYTQTWFQSDRPGTYRLFCTEYCGTDHSRMVGEVVVMTQPDYARWLDAQPDGDTLAQSGARLFVSMGCSGCHNGSARVRAPDLAGRYGHAQPLEGGGFAQVDEAYLRDSILQPGKQIAAGYAPVMPSYQGVASEDQLIQLIAYLKAMPPIAQGGER